MTSGDVADLAGQVAGHRVDRVGQVLPGSGDASHVGLSAQLSFGADLAGDAGDLGGEGGELVDHRVDGVLELEDLALRVDGDLLAQVALRDGRRDLRDAAHLARQVAGELVDVVGQVAPGAGRAGHICLAAEFSFDTHLARNRRYLVRENRERIGHAVDGIGERGNFAFRFDEQLLFHVTVGDRGHDLGDAAHLVR